MPLEMPKIVIPDNSPEWVIEMFPTLIKSIYDTFNGKVKKIVSDFMLHLMIYKNKSMT